jgi:hypothetical protein
LLKGISLWQPWASLIAVGAKRIETRSWQIGYRGLLAIHATKTFEFSGSATYYDPQVGPLMREALAPLYPDYSKLPLGAIVAVAQLVDCMPTRNVCPHLNAKLATYGWNQGGYYAIPQADFAFGDYSPGRWAWLLENVQRLPKPIPRSGARGLWVVPDDVVERIRDQGMEL